MSQNVFRTLTMSRYQDVNFEFLWTKTEVFIPEDDQILFPPSTVKVNGE